MRSSSRQIYSFLITTVLLICTSQATPVDLPYEGDEAFPLHNAVVDNATAYQLAKAAYEKILHLDSRAVAYSDQSDPGNANQIMDMALNQVRNMIRDKNLNRMTVPDFEKTFEKGSGVLKVKGSFRGFNVWLESLLSIARKSDATIRLDGASVILGSSLGLKTLQLGMNYVAKLAMVKVDGYMDVQVASNTIEFEGSIGYSTGKCAITLRHLKIAELGKIKVKATGLGALNGLFSDIVSWTTSRLHNQIRHTVEEKAKAFLEKNLSKVKCPIFL